jgi:omega-amidase
MIVNMVQNSPQKGRLQENLDQLDQLLYEVGDGSFVFLPELFNTSYLLQPTELDPDDFRTTLDWMTHKARSGQYFIGGSLPIPEGDKMYNRWLGVDAAGEVYSYDKIHLFVPGGEGRAYLGGKEVNQFTIQGQVVRPLICYDLRFPYISFQQPDVYYDVLVYAANWPAPRIEQWKQLLKARAIENQAYVVGVNRVGVDHYGNEYPGHSMVVDFMGRVISEMDGNVGVTRVELQLEAMYQYREKHPFLDDMYPETFNSRVKICREH